LVKIDDNVPKFWVMNNVRRALPERDRFWTWSQFYNFYIYNYSAGVEVG
jgi:hypothetical protein